MRITLLFAIGFSLFAATAHAEGEGNGDPFPFRPAPIAVSHPALVADTGATAYPDAAGRAGQVVTFGNDVLTAAGSEGAVQTAASLPPGFSDGTAASMQAEAVRRYFAGTALPKTIARQLTGRTHG
jgi:hypothetical protein